MPNNIITLVGPNALLVEHELRQIKGNFVKQFDDLAVEMIDGEEASQEQIRASLESMPFLSPRKLLIIKRLGSNKAASENIDKLLELADDKTDLVLVEPKPDKRSVYYKMIKKKTDLREFPQLDEQSLAKWLVAEAKNQGADLSFSDARFLVERVGANQQLLNTELTKLLDYDQNISRQSIELLTETSPQGTIFNLLDAAFAGNTKRALELYEVQRLQKVEPQAILAMIVWQLHVVALVSASKKSIDEVARETKQSPFVLGKAKAISDRLSRGELAALLDSLCILDKRLKTESIDADEALKQLLLDLG